MTTAPKLSADAAPGVHSLPVEYRLLWYTIRSVLGQGGFGITYLAHDTNLDQAVAIKEYMPQVFASRCADYSLAPASAEQAGDFRWGLQRFIDEGRLLARFDHPAIVRVHSVFEANSTAYLVMRYEEGESLETLLKREPILPEGRLRAILADVMDGLEVVHHAGFIHRDVKPSNLYLRDDGHALLLDFGAARQALAAQTQGVTALVSPGYAPFEQYRSDGLAQGPWTDIYGLGATAYRAIVGRAPPPAVDRSHRIIDGDGDHQPSLATSDIGGYAFGLLAAIDRALAFRAADRPATIAAWRELSNSDESVTAQPKLPVPARFARAEARITTERPFVPGDRTAPELVTPELIERPRQRWLLVAGILLGCGLGLPYALRSSPSTPLPGTTTDAIESIARNTNPVMPSVAELLKAAASDLTALRLTTPPNNNALAKYRAVLAIDPRNSQANTGLQKIVGRYLDLAAAAAHNEDFRAARDYLLRAQEANPSDPRTREALVALARSESRAPRIAKEGVGSS